jgi:hypothetical protein
MPMTARGSRAICRLSCDLVSARAWEFRNQPVSRFVLNARRLTCSVEALGASRRSAQAQEAFDCDGSALACAPLKPIDRLARHAHWLVFAACFVLYACTAYPGVGGRAQWGDAAKWQYIGSVLGVSHPPGSPLYVLLTFVWGKLPLAAEIGHRVILFSAACGAGAAALVFATIRRFGTSVGAALVGAGSFAIARAVWNFSTEAEVYAPLALAIALVLHRFVVWQKTRSLRDYAIGCFVYALGFGVHYAMLLFLPALLVVTLWTDARWTLKPRALAVVGVAIAIGLLPFVWLWFRAADADYSELPHSRSWSSFRDYVLVRQYRGGMFENMSAKRLTWAPMFTLAQVGPGPALLVPFGIFAIARDRERRPLAAFFALAVLVPIVFLAGYREGDDLGNVVVPLVALATLVGVGVNWIVSQLPWPRAREVAYVLALAVGAFGAARTGKKLEVADPLDHLTWDTDHAKAYRWDVPCILHAAEAKVTIVPPFEDYGARQIVHYYELADRDVRNKSITFRYMGEPPPGDWTWARQPSMPSPREGRVVYAFQRGHADRLRAAGFAVEERTLDSLGGCGQGKPDRTFFRAAPRP